MSINRLSPDELSSLITSVGIHRKSRQLSPVEVAMLLNRLQSYQSIGEISSQIGLDGTNIRRFLALLSLPPEVHSLVMWGREKGYLSFSVAQEIATKIKELNQDEISLIVKDAIAHQRTKKEVVAILQRRLRSGVALKECIEEIEKLRPYISREYIFIGQLPPQIVEESQKLLDLLAELVGRRNVLSASIKQGRFSFTLTEEGAKTPEVESYLTSSELENFIANLLVRNKHDYK